MGLPVDLRTMVWRVRRVSAAFVCAVLVAAVGCASATAALPSVSFGSPGETPFVIPPGVSSVQIDAIGGRGAESGIDASGAQGGPGAEVVGSMNVIAGQTIYVEVGVGGAGGGASGV